MRWLSNYPKNEPLWDSDHYLVTGRPQATAIYTVEELEGMDLIGVYSTQDEE